MAGRINNREGARARAERDARGVHRDVLRLLLEQGVHQEGVFKLHALGAAGSLDALGLAILDGVRVEEQAADEGGFAVVHVAHDDEVQVWKGRAGF